MVIEHPLQPFSHEYFTGSEPLFSYSAENCAGKRKGGRRTDSAGAVHRRTDRQPEEEWRQLDNAS